jgi:hypothetical protein
VLQVLAKEDSVSPYSAPISEHIMRAISGIWRQSCMANVRNGVVDGCLS